jgi:hypothetical protein
MKNQLIPLGFNRWQILSHLYFANRNKHVCGRGTGKTTNLAFIMYSIALDMPRSANALVCRTYLQALTRTIPAIISGLETLGCIQNIHYVIGKEPPKSWPRPYFPPVSHEHFISFRNGSGFHIVSQDRKGSSRGFNIDSWVADEGLNLNKQQIDDEISVATRANVGRFDYSRYHLSETIVSSQPILPESQWLLDDAKYYSENGNDYRDYRNSLTDILIKVIDAETEAEMQSYWEEALQIKRNWRFYQNTRLIPITGQKLTSFFIDADVFDNIQNLGWKYIKLQRASMSDLNFKVEILNALFTISERGFYPDLCDRHKYDMMDYSILDQYGFNIKSIEDITSTQDPSIDSRMPIHISCDYGGSFNCMVASQEYVDEERFISEFYEYHPKKISDVVAKFLKFFANHQNKEVHYWFDQTAIGSNASKDFTYADEVQLLLRNAGWKVIEHYSGAAPVHYMKYQFMGNILSERDTRTLPRVRFHRERCAKTYESMKLVTIKTRSSVIEKDKTPERKMAVDQARAPHLSDAVDQLLYYKHAAKQDDSNVSEASPMMMS